jgi:hypothetical protein
MNGCIVNFLNDSGLNLEMFESGRRDRSLFDRVSQGRHRSTVRLFVNIRSCHRVGISLAAQRLKR